MTTTATTPVNVESNRVCCDPELSLSDDSENDAMHQSNGNIEVRGYLSKWTNYIYGWQPRYIVLKDGILSYYKSETESDFGCRGAISLCRAIIKPHETDELRFDVMVNNYNNWCLRAETSEDRMHWVEVLQMYKEDFINQDESGHLRRNSSSLSLQSATVSMVSGNSYRRTQHTLQQKVGEIQTYRDILFAQIENLQNYFDSNSKKNDQKLIGREFDSEVLVRPYDFKGEAITFRATTTGVLLTLQHCVEIIAENETAWRNKLDREIAKRRKLEQQINQLYERERKLKCMTYSGPDLEEGPHSKLPEDEFFDAVETGLDKIEEDMHLRSILKQQRSLQQETDHSHAQEYDKDQSNDKQDNKRRLRDGSELAKRHFLWPEIEMVCLEQLRYARAGVGEDGSGWQILADEGEIKMYKREEELNGLVMDPLKAYHSVKGVTAREMCYYFFTPEFRNEWETTLEDCTVLEKISPNTYLFLQTHKRVWPATQRDALFWSHMRQISDGLDKGAADCWIVCNKSTDYSKKDTSNGKCIRIYLTVILACQTFIAGKKTFQDNLTREDLTCKITYCSVVNPGGWAPATALRAVYKREYPKFLKRFTSYVIDQCKSKPIMY